MDNVQILSNWLTALTDYMASTKDGVKMLREVAVVERDADTYGAEIEAVETVAKVESELRIDIDTADDGGMGGGGGGGGGEAQRGQGVQRGGGGLKTLKEEKTLTPGSSVETAAALVSGAK